jgi:hypothetical protein
MTQQAVISATELIAVIHQASEIDRGRVRSAHQVISGDRKRAGTPLAPRAPVSPLGGGVTRRRAT